MARSCLVLLLCSLLLAVPLIGGAAAEEMGLSLDGRWKLQGFVGSYPTKAVLEVDGTQVSGVYSYDRWQEDIPLIGIVDRGGAVVLFELDGDQYRTGSFQGTLSQDGFIAAWTDPHGNQELAVEWQATARDIWSGMWSRAFLGADGQWKWAVHESASVEFWDWDGTTASMEIWASSGSHVGYADGQVSLKQTTASWRDPDQGGAFSFERQGDVLLVSAENAAAYAGVGVSFGGTYRQRFGPDGSPTLWDLGVFPTEELDRAFFDLVGEYYYQKYLYTFHLLQFSEDKDGLGAVVVDGYVRGLPNDVFGRIMYTEDGYFMAAVSEGDGWLTYISNHPRFELEVPETFDDLRDRLAFG